MAAKLPQRTVPFDIANNLLKSQTRQSIREFRIKISFLLLLRLYYPTLLLVFIHFVLHRIVFLKFTTMIHETQFLTSISQLWMGISFAKEMRTRT